MRHFCTYFDFNYANRGLVLYDSLVRHSRQPFILWILCFDPETFALLHDLALPNTRLISLDQFEANDEDLRALKPQRSKVEYYWTCTPSLPLYILRQHPGVDLITYLDADMCFYQDPQPLFDELGQGSIAIIEHRYAERHLSHVTTSGIYNVGWLTFRNNPDGLACLEWWRARCNEWCFARYEDGKFGDQLYLDDWPTRFDGVVVLQHKGANVAPWNIERYQIHTTDHTLNVDEQPLLFFHFHGLKLVSSRLFQPTGLGYRFRPWLIHQLYLPYVARLQVFSARMELPRPSHPIPWWEAIQGLLGRRYCLTRPRWLSVLLWWTAQSGSIELQRGQLAYQERCLAETRWRLALALFWNPTYLSNRWFVAMWLESLIGTESMQRVRDWRSLRSYQQS
jgi:hypothetical protein